MGYITSLKGFDGLGRLDRSTAEAVQSNKNVIDAVLNKARLRGLGSTDEDIIEMQEFINTYNPNISEDEIKAWVHHKRSMGVPMQGWEKYFLKNDGQIVKNVLAQSECLVYNSVSGAAFKNMPAGAKLGVLTETQEWYYVFLDQYGNSLKVKKSDAKLKESGYKPSEKDLNRLVEKGLLFYNRGELLPAPVYRFANIYDRMLELDKDEAIIKEKYGESVLQAQRKFLEDTKPKMLSFFDPDVNNRPFIHPLGGDSRNFIVSGISDTAPFSERRMQILTNNINSGQEYNLLDLFEKYLDSLDATKFLKKTNGSQIIEVFINNGKRPRWMDEKGWLLVKEHTQSEAMRLFPIFMDEVLTYQDRQRLDFDWNRKYNGFPEIQYEKVPVGLRMSRNVKGQDDFSLRPIQRNGIAFMELVNSGCISYDVGVGKTFTAIAELSCALSQGRCQRPLVVVPNSTYENWISELFGNDGQNGMLANTGINFNNWYNLGKGIKFGEDLVKNGSVTLVTYEGFMKMGFSEDVAGDTFNEMTSILLQSTDNARGKAAVKAMEKIKAAIGKNNKNTMIEFDKAGFDYIVFDEAHKLKNIFSKVVADSQHLNSYRQTSGEPSSRGLKAFIMTNYVQRVFGGNIMLLTATPFTNAPLEIYSMLSLIAFDSLKQRHIHNVHKFFETFIYEELDEVVTPDLKIDYKWITRSFKNRVALQRLIYANFDYKTGEEAGVKRPSKINFPLIYQDGKKLEPKSQILTYLRMTPRQKDNQFNINEYIKHFPDETLKGLAMSLDNAMSPFMYEKSNPSSYKEFIEESPKIKFACDAVIGIKKWHEDRGEECSGQVLYANRGKDFFPLIKKYLEEEGKFKKGLKVDWSRSKFDEVEIITGGDADDKDEIMKAFNEGVTKIIIGTSTIREGVNLQKRSTCLYNMYPEWNPTDIQQLEGRIYRQGNKYQYVRIVLPLIQDSMDTFIFQKLQEKTNRINDIWYRSDRGNVLDVDSLDPEEVKFALITDVEMLANRQINKECDRIERQISVFKGEIKILEEFKSTYQNYLSNKDKTIEFVRKQVAYFSLMDYIKTKPTDEDLKKLSEAEQKKIKKVTEAYEYAVNFLNTVADAEDYDKNLILTARKLNNAEYDYQLSNYADWLGESVKKVKKAEDSVLSKRGMNRHSNIDEAIAAIESDITAETNDYKYRKSAEYRNEVMEAIIEKKREMNIIGKSLEQRLDEFAATNYIMAVPFNDNVVIPNNTMPTEDQVKKGITPKVDTPAPASAPKPEPDADEAERLRLIAVAQMQQRARKRKRLQLKKKSQ